MDARFQTTFQLSTILENIHPFQMLICYFSQQYHSITFETIIEELPVNRTPDNKFQAL